MPQRIWVPTPASKLYGVSGTDPETMRDRMVRMYGEATVQQAELSVVLDLMMLNGVIAPQEFVTVISKKLERIDLQRQAASGYKG